ncbi:hypothetical protein VULLAG_LOCUS14180 [Vulpes lagopus]
MGLRQEVVKLFGLGIQSSRELPTELRLQQESEFASLFSDLQHRSHTHRERERERERGRDTGRGRSRLHTPGARRGIRSQVSRIAPWVKGRCQTAAPPRDPMICHLCTRGTNY